MTAVSNHPFDQLQKVLRKSPSPRDTGACAEWKFSYYLLIEEMKDLAGRTRACKLDNFPEGHGKGLVWWILQAGMRGPALHTGVNMSGEMYHVLTSVRLICSTVKREYDIATLCGIWGGVKA